MRVLIATGIYPPDIGGPATYAYQLRLNYKTREMVCDVVTYGDGHEVTTVDGVTTIPRHWSRFKKYWAFFRTVQKQQQNYDVVYAQDLISTGIPCAIAKAFGRKFKLVIRLGGDFLWEKAFNREWTDVPLERYYDQSKNRQERSHLTWFRWVLKKTDHIIFSTVMQQRLYQKVFGLDAKKTSVITNPFPEFQPPRESPNKTLVFAGRLIKLKNIRRVIDAVLQVRDLQFVIIGDGPDKEAIVQYIADVNAGDQVTVLDPESHNELQHRIASAWAVIVPSISEISPNTVLEAVAIGTPVIVTRYCGFAQQYPDLRYIDPFSVANIADTLTQLQDPAVYEEYSKSLKEIDTSRGWHAVGKDHDDVFLSV